MNLEQIFQLELGRRFFVSLLSEYLISTLTTILIYSWPFRFVKCLMFFVRWSPVPGAQCMS